MEAQAQDSDTANQGTERSEPVRSRWTPKPEQILILESIFNSGMVNPSKDETVGIRKLLEKYGAVGDANVFYWFQNRRSRSRRRQRQLQASLATVGQAKQPTQHGAIPYECNSAMEFRPPPLPASSFITPPSVYLAGSSSSTCGGFGSSCADHNLFTVSGHLGLPEMDHNSAVASSLCPSNNQNFQYQTGFITVLINGVPTEVPKGQFDIKSLVGLEVILVHSSGVPVPVNEIGFLVDSLQHGESYFLVPRSA